MTDNDGDSITAAKVDWNPSVERMLTKWCDEAKCFEWMHTEAFSYFDKRARFIVVTTNVLIALSGLTNVIAGSTTVNGFQLSWVFGSLSIIISIANMLQEKLAYIAKATRHYQYSIQWGTIRRKIEEGISIAPEARKDCRTFLKYLRQDINQVSTDGNTMIPKFIREACFQKFNAIENFDVPDICGKMEHTPMYSKLEVIHPNTQSLLSYTKHNVATSKEAFKKLSKPDSDSPVSVGVTISKS